MTIMSQSSCPSKSRSVGRLRRERGKQRTIRHSGGAVGSTANLLLYPDYDIVVAWAPNGGQFNANDLFALVIGLHPRSYSDETIYRTPRERVHPPRTA